MPERQAKASKRRSPKQEKLIVELANPENTSIAEAGRKAGFSEASVRSTVYSLANSPYISAEVQKRRERALAHHQVTPEEVLGSAVFQMRSSMRDVLDDGGSYSFDKACETGAIDLLKKHKETFREIKDDKGRTVETVKTVEVELLTNESGRKEVANYIGLGFASSNVEMFNQALKMIIVLTNQYSYSLQKAIDDTVFIFKEKGFEVDEARLGLMVKGE